MQNISQDAERLKRLSRIQAVAGFMKWAVTAAALILLAAAALVALGIVIPDVAEFFGEPAIDIGGKQYLIRDLETVQRFIFAMISTIALVILVAISWQVRQLFSRFSQMDFFSAATLSHILSLGRLLVALGAYDFLSTPVASVLMSWHFPAGQRALSISIEGGETFLMIFGTVIILFGWILREAASISEENKLFI